MVNPSHRQARILIVDDEPANVRLLQRILQREGFGNIEATHDPGQCLALFASYAPDIILLDLHMPELDGFALMAQLRERIPEGDFVPIVVLTADVTPEARQRALRSGAKDFITKPVDPTEVVLRIRNLLQTRHFYRQLQGQNATLERNVSDRTRQLERAQIEILERLARAAEYRDDETGHHAQRVGHTSAMIARRVGLGDEEVVLLRRAAPLHDVGKIGIPDGILLKPGRLTPDEFAEMKKHAAIGAGILSGSSFAVLKMAEEIALYHHENWDGSGYLGLTDDGIPLSARIVHLADVVDALAHERPYKAAWPPERILGLVREKREEYFDPDLVDAILAIHAEGGLEIDGPPPPIADIFRSHGREDQEELAARAADAEARIYHAPTVDAAAGPDASA
jgi:putative two-component system response regulator